MVSALAGMHSSTYLNHDPAHPSVLTDSIISLRAKNPGENVAFSFRLPASCKGRFLSVVRMPMTALVSEVRAGLYQQENFEESVEKIEFWTDAGEHMEMDKPMSQYYPSGLFTGTILVQGGFREIYIAMAGVEVGLLLRYDVHLTLTDVVKCILVKLKTMCGGDLELVDLNKVQLSHNSDTLPIGKCFRYEDRSVSRSTKLFEIGQAKANEPCTVMFKRSRNGVPHFYVLPMTGEQTVFDVTEAVFLKEREENLRQGDNGWVAGVLHPKKLQRQSVFWDDEDESVSPCGVRTVYIYRPGDRGYEASSDLDQNEAYLSFHPPPRGQPDLVTIHDDYSIPHLSDLGILPGTTLTLSFFSTSLKQWSHDIAPLPPDSADDISIKIMGGPVIRLPIVMDAPLEQLYVTLWKATGLSPHVTVLLTDEGRLLHRGDSMHALGLLPETILVCRTQNTASH